MARRTTRLVVMAKAPIAGFAKTRLIPALGAEGAARLAARLLEHTMDQARTAAFGELVLACAPDAAHPAFDAQRRQGDVKLTDQGEGDLGARMQRQAAHAFEQRIEQVILIGTDAPALDAAVLCQADDALARTGVDAVFVPAVDGGYALIGLRQPRPSLFDGIPWSSAGVMAATRARLAEAGLRHVELTAVHDIDDVADLAHVPPGWL